MNSKKQFLKSYQEIDKLSKNTNAPDKKDVDNLSIYKSKEDEKIIKDYHYAKFQKNLHMANNDDTLKKLALKDEWSQDDIQDFLSILK